MGNILKSLVIVVAVAAVAGGATWSYFSDTAAITGNTFSTGTLDLVIDSNPSSSVYTWSDGFANPVDPFAKVQPGSTGSQILDIKNVGDVDGIATIKFDTTTWSALGDNLYFTVSYDANHDGTFETAVASGSLAAWNHNTYTLGAITSSATTDGTPTAYLGKIASVKIDWSVPTSAGNNIQGKSVKIDTVLGLEQTH